MQQPCYCLGVYFHPGELVKDSRHKLPIENHSEVAAARGGGGEERIHIVCCNGSDVWSVVGWL